MPAVPPPSAPRARARRRPAAAYRRARRLAPEGAHDPRWSAVADWWQAQHGAAAAAAAAAAPRAPRARARAWRPPGCDPAPPPPVPPPPDPPTTTTPLPPPTGRAAARLDAHRATAAAAAARAAALDDARARVRSSLAPILASASARGPTAALVALGAVPPPPGSGRAGLRRALRAARAAFHPDRHARTSVAAQAAAEEKFKALAGVEERWVAD